MNIGNWWYSVVRASPDPESGEQANVALLLGNGRLFQLEYDPGLPRIKCIADPVERKLLKEAIRDMERKLGTLDGITELRQHLGPQVLVSEPKKLYSRPDAKVVRALRERYLGKERLRRASKPRVDSGEMARIDQTLQKLMARHGFRLRLRKKPSPDRLFPDAAARIFPAPVPALDRALRGSRKDLLIGGVTIRSRNPLKSVPKSVFQHGRAFWHYKEARERIQLFAGRQVRTVGLIQPEDSHDSGEAREASDYIAHIWGQDADAVIHADDAGDLKLLENEISWVSGDTS